MCKLLDIPRSGYYLWLNKKPSQRELNDRLILQAIRRSHASSKGRYGLDKIHSDVNEEIRCGRNRIYRLMKENGIQAKRKRKYKTTTDSKHNLPRSENILNRDFSTTGPNEKWVTDISYISTYEGFLYLAVVKDLFNKEIVGWHADDNMRTELISTALRSAIHKRNPGQGLIHHSDQGAQYCSADYMKILKDKGFISSMSRKGNCWDNACAETFFNSIKSECVYLTRYRTRQEAYRDIFNYIEGFYNLRRKHAALSYLAPANYLKHWQHGQNESRAA